MSKETEIGPPIKKFKDVGPPHLIWEKGYWLDPVQSMAGISFLLIGLMLGALIF